MNRFHVRWKFTLLVLSIVANISKAQHWQPLGVGFDFQARILFADSITNSFYAGGNFQHAGGINASGIAVGMV